MQADVELLDQYNFNFQVMYALGERTFFTFRRRVYQYPIEYKEQEDIVFRQFILLSNHFIKIADINTQQQRMDSTN